MFYYYLFVYSDIRIHLFEPSTNYYNRKSHEALILPQLKKLINQSNYLKSGGLQGYEGIPLKPLMGLCML